MSTLITRAGLQTMAAETPQTPIEMALAAETAVAETPKPQMQSFYIKTRCTACNRDAIFFPQYRQTVCPSCRSLKLYTKEDNASLDDYVPQFAWDQLNEEAKKSNLALSYIYPESDPMFGAPGRNEPCHCGSGEKYKKCCLRDDEAARDKLAMDMTNSRRDKAILQNANEYKLISEVFEKMNKENLTELNTNDIKFIPFVDRAGNLKTEEVAEAAVAV